MLYELIDLLNCDSISTVNLEVEDHWPAFFKLAVMGACSSAVAPFRLSAPLE